MEEEILKEVTLPSGANLKMNPAPFKDAHALFQSFLIFQSAMKDFYPVEVLEEQDQKKAVRALVPWSLSSPAVHAALTACFKRCLYRDLPINEKTFEPVEARGDFIEVCTEVAAENLNPFMKGLWQELSRNGLRKGDSSQK